MPCCKLLGMLNPARACQLRASDLLLDCQRRFASYSAVICAQVPNLAYEIVTRQRGMPDSQRSINLQGFLVGEHNFPKVACMAASPQVVRALMVQEMHGRTPGRRTREQLISGGAIL